MESTLKLNSCLKLIKKHLKRKNITYQQLADKLDVSLLTIKRQLNSDDIAFSKLLSLSEASGVSLTELLQAAEEKTVKHTSFTEYQDLTFCRHPSVYLYFVELFNNHKTPAQIESQYELTPASTHIYLRKLEEIGLISLSAKGYVTFLVEAPLGFAESTNFVYKEFEKALIEVSSRLSEAEKNEDFVVVKPLTLPDELRNKMYKEIVDVISTYAEVSERFYNNSEHPPSTMVACGYRVQSLSSQPTIENVVSLN